MVPVHHDQFYMRLALGLAEIGAASGEVPIGCVLVSGGRIRAMATNEVVQKQHPLYHAEWLAIDRAQRGMGRLRLPDATLYTTLEPCAMCAGAILLARIPRVVIAAMDAKRGCTGSIYNLLDDPAFNHRAEIRTGVLEAESSARLSGFFAALRAQKKRARAERNPSDGYS